MPDFLQYRWGRGLVFLALALLVWMIPIPVSTPAPAARTIPIEASQYAFSPGEIAIMPGDRVTIELVSTDVMHGLSLDGYDLNLTAEPGQPSRGTFVAGKAGVIRFRCSIPCGNLHPFMIGKIQIGPNLLLYRAMALGILAILAAIWSRKAMHQAAGARNPRTVLGEAD